MHEKMVRDCGESRLGTASCRHDRRQETCRCRRCQTRTGQACFAREAQEGRGDRRPARPRADALWRLAVQRQGDGLLAPSVILSEAKDLMPVAIGDEILRFAQDDNGGGCFRVWTILAACPKNPPPRIVLPATQVR